MYIAKVLKRKDAVSVIVSVVLAMIIVQSIPSLTARLAQVLSGEKISSATVGVGWQSQYLFPVIVALLQVITLEIILRVYVYLHGLMKK